MLTHKLLFLVGDQLSYLILASSKDLFVVDKLTNNKPARKSMSKNIYEFLD